MHTRSLHQLFIPCLLLTLALPCYAGDKAAGPLVGAPPPRGRATALMTALFHHTPSPGIETGKSESTQTGVFPSTSPDATLALQERGKIFEFAKSLIYEGGYYPAEIYQLLGYANENTARIASITRQLDRGRNDRPTSWEITGRVGRSGMVGISDNWAMAPGALDAAHISTPGTLAYVPALSVVYATRPEDGMEAAAQLAILKDDDMRAEATARAAFSLITRILLADGHDKNAWIRGAARDSGDADTEYDIKSVRVRDWKYLRGEECAMGRFERAVYLWYHGTSYDQILASGRKQLQSRETLAFLSSLAAATYGQEGLPRTVIAAASADRELIDLISDLHDLATSEAILQVRPEK